MNRIDDNLVCTGENEGIVRAFAASGVKYVIIGGLAVSWYCADRQADDMDLLVDPTPDNSARIARALRGLGMNVFGDNSFARLGLQVPLKHLHYADILTPKEDGPTYSEVAKDAVDAKLFNIPVRVASAVSLIRMKEQALASAETQRAKHLKDIECLKKHAA